MNQRKAHRNALQGCLLLLLKIFIILLVLSILIPAILVAAPDFTADTDVVGDLTIENTAIEQKEAASAPYILVHGMGGTAADFSSVSEVLSTQGKTSYAATVGPYSSAWDRACELYAQLTGTRVDYGAAHAKKCHHERYGRDYTGRAIVPGGWSLNSPINLVGHSFGGVTARVFASLLAYGATAELEATGEKTSELFRGGHANAVHTVITLSAPNNGTVATTFSNDLLWPVAGMTFGAHIQALGSGSADYSGTDFMLDQFQLSAEPGSGDKVSFHLLKTITPLWHKDHCFYDMTPSGARALNKRYPTVPSVYYLAYSADMTTDTANGKHRVVANENASGPLVTIANLMGRSKGWLIDGQVLSADWQPNDGLVPVASAKHPNTDNDNAEAYQEGMTLQPGIWYDMPTQTGSHGDYLSSFNGVANSLTDFYRSMVQLVDSL